MRRKVEFMAAITKLRKGGINFVCSTFAFTVHFTEEFGDKNNSKLLLQGNLVMLGSKVYFVISYFRSLYDS